jgi:hypothetical protein
VNGIELFAYLILPLSIGAGVWGAVLFSERRGHHHAAK